MEFCWDFSSGDVVCEECNLPAKNHIDLFINKKYTDITNSKYYRNTESFLKSSLMLRYNFETGKITPYKCFHGCDYDEFEE